MDALQRILAAASKERVVVESCDGPCAHKGYERCEADRMLKALGANYLGALRADFQRIIDDKCYCWNHRAEESGDCPHDIAKEALAALERAAKALLEAGKETK